MSLSAGARRTCRLYYCYECRRAIRIISFPTSDVFCPRCYGRFLHEIDFPRPAIPPEYPPFRPFPYRFLDPEENMNHVPGGRWVLFGRPHDHHHPIEPIPRRRIVPSPPLPPPAPARPMERYDIPPVFNTGDYFAGQNLNTLIEELTQNDRPGPPPASTSAIEALPTVAITQAHLSDGSQCPVCKEDFQLGEEAKEMPCKHVYHSDCIIPWLNLHNTCPVCRFELPGNNGNGRERTGDIGGESGERQELARWNPFSMIWPNFPGTRPEWEDEYRTGHDEIPRGGLGVFYSWWRSLFLF